MEDRLAKLLEEKIVERREFQSLIETFRYTKPELYQKMSQAGESRNSAFFNKKAKWKLALVLPENNSNQPKSPINEPKNTSITKSKQGKGKFVKGGKVSLGKNKEKQIEIQDVQEVMDGNDEVIQALNWAHDTLLKEHLKRKKLRAKKGSLRRRATKKLQTMWAFHHQAEMLKRAKNKKAKDDGIITEDTTKKEEQGALIDDIKIEHAPVEDEDETEDNSMRRKTIIINLQKRLSFKKSSQRDPNKCKELKSDEDKLNEARAHLKWLQDKQKQNILVDFFGVPKGHRSVVVPDDEQTLSRHGSNKSGHELPHQGSTDLPPDDNSSKTEGHKGSILRAILGGGGI